LDQCSEMFSAHAETHTQRRTRRDAETAIDTVISAHAVSCSPWSLRLLLEALRQRAGSDLWPGVTSGVQAIYTMSSHNALLCQDDRLSWMERGGGGWWLDGSIPGQKLTWNKEAFFEATEETCAFSHLIQDNGRRCLAIVSAGGSGCFCSGSQWNNRLAPSPRSDLTFKTLLEDTSGLL